MRTQLARLAQLCSRAAAVPAGVARLCQAGALPQLQALTWARGAAAMPACAAAASSTLQGGWAVHWPLVSLAAAQPAAAAAPLIEHATLLGGGVPALEELRADSVQRKRKRAMNKHKHRKRRKLNRHRR